MELKPGYKQTEVGLIPEDWEIARLGDKTTKIGSGITPTGGARVYKKEGRPFIRSQNVGWGALLLDDMVFIDEKTHTTFPDTEIKIDDVFLNITGASIGRSAIADNRVQRGNVNQHVCIIRTNQEELHSLFLNYLLLSNVGQRQIDSFQAGGNRQGLNFGQVRSFRLPLPRKSEQQAISNLLSDVDVLINSLEKLITKKHNLKQAAMQQLLTGQIRLPGFHGEWQTRTLGDLITHCSSGATPRRNIPHYYKGDIRWITSGELNYNRITDTTEKITSEAVAQTNLKILPKGTFLMAITGLEAEGTRGSCGIVGEPSTTNQSCMAIFPTSELLNEYLFYYYVLRGKALALQYCQGTKQQSYTARLVKRLPITLPSTTDEQAAIVDVLSDIDVELTALEARRDKTRALKQGIMQALLTGKVRLI